MKEHNYQATIRWTGNLGTGTSDYKSYSRDHELEFVGKAALPGSSDPAFRGDPSRYNPEESLVAALSACHMLWYLHLCAVNAVVVTAYVDQPSGVMTEDRDVPGKFVRVALRPAVTVTAASDAGKALELHREAHRLCYIANSVNFPVTAEPSIRVEGA